LVKKGSEGAGVGLGHTADVYKDMKGTYTLAWDKMGPRFPRTPPGQRATGAERMRSHEDDVFKAMPGTWVNDWRKQTARPDMLITKNRYGKVPGYVQGVTDSSPTPLWVINEAKSLKNGQHHTVFGTDGTSYRGEWANDAREGLGVFTFKNGDFYEGYWVDGQRSGKGNMWVWVPGEGRHRLLYTGDWLEDERHGFGVYYNKVGERYDGDWEGGVRHGLGKQVYEDGSVYEGEWAGDMRHGKGSLTLPDANVYDGHWASDLKEGAGTFYYVKRGMRYDGEWLRGTPKAGTYTSLNAVDNPLPNLELQDKDAVVSEALEAIQREREALDQQEMGASE